MKKLIFAANKSLFGQIATCTCLAGASAGIIFGVSAGTFKVEYLDLDNPQARLRASIQHSCYSQDIVSQWNMFQKGNEGEKGFIRGIAQPETNIVQDMWWTKVHGSTIRWDKQRPGYVNPKVMDLETKQGDPLSSTAQAARKSYSALVIDGATHTAMDRSFNQGLYNGLVNFIKNAKTDVKDDKDALVFKPSQDSTQEFINIYRAVAAKVRILCLAGFNHVTPINALGKQLDSGLYEFSDDNIANTGMMLMDGDITNNQNVASVLFRSDEPAFLAALATCMYFYNNAELYHANFQDMSVAAYGGTAIPTVVVYMGGFQRGIEFFNRFILKDSLLKLGAASYMKEETGTHRSYVYFRDKLLPYSKYKDEIAEIRALPISEEKTARINEMLDQLYQEYSIKMIKLGDFGTHFSGSFTAGDAIGISKQLLNRGASAIIAIAGPQSLDTAQEIMNQNSKCIVIGVDSAMERSDYQKPFTNKAYTDRSVGADESRSAQASNIIKFSAVKDMTNVSDKILRLAGEGKHWDVDNDKPWTSVSSLPKYDESAVFPDSYLKFKYDDDNHTFDIEGFDDSSSFPATVLRIPLTKEKSGVTYKLHRISGFAVGGSGADNLKSVETLCFKGQRDKNQPIIFGSSEKLAFDYSNWSSTSETDKRPGIKYIDFTNLCAEQIQVEAPSGGGAPLIFTQMITDQPQTCSVYHKGIIKFNKLDKESTKENLYKDKMLGNTSQCLNWGIVEPDPYKSICSFGFKTCGNIENGLISISWDGWPLLFEALNFVEGNVGTGQSTTFFEVWKELGEKYCDLHKDELDPEFVQKFKGSPTFADFMTYKTDSVLNKNYSDLMAVLGYVLRNQNISVPSDMTVLFDENGDPYLPTESTPMSILDWLKTNMYFTV